MPKGQLTGVRIRDHRLDRGISQTDLAREAGISPSYLNLIEHGRRRIGGKLLLDIARALSLDPAVLTEATEPALLEALELAAAGLPGAGLSGAGLSDTGLSGAGLSGAGLSGASLPRAGAEVPKAADFAARFPGWAATVAAQARRIAHLEDRVAQLSDRLAHDPHLDTALHEVISVVTSIRSTASILVAGEGVDPDWQGRFHQNLHADSRRLAEASQALAAYLEAPKTGAQAGADAGAVGAGLSPGEEVERFQEQLLLTPEVFEPADIENAGFAPAGVQTAQTDPLASLRSPQARAMAARWLAARRAEALALPMPRLAAAVARLGHDPAVLAADLGADLALVLRRMAALPAAQGHPPMGLAVCDAAGAVTEQKPVAGFALPRGAPACPLWPLFAALTRPGQPVRAVVELPGDAAPRLTCYAIARPVGPPAFDAPPRIEALMLVVADAPTGPARPAGRTCRICPRPDCPARREPSILPGPV